MAITTLKEFWQAEKDAATNLAKDARRDLAAAQVALAAAKAALAARTAAMKKKEDEIAAKRALLATTTVPAEAAALLAKIRDLIVEHRRLQGAVLDDGDDVRFAEEAADEAGRIAARADATLADASAALAEAEADEKKRTTLKTALGAAPLSTLKASATALLAGAKATDAATQVAANFPQHLREAAEKRHERRAKRPTELGTLGANLETALATEVDTNGGLDGKAEKARLAFERADAVARAYQGAAKVRYDKADTLLTRLKAVHDGGSGAPADILTAAEKAAIAATADRDTAADDAATALDAAIAAVDDAEDAVAAELLAQVAADVDQLHKTGGALALKKAALAQKKLDLAAARAAFDAAKRKTLDEWEAVAPDGAWKVLTDYFDGLLALDELSTGDSGSDLATKLTNAEKDYAEALANAAKARRRREAYADARSTGALRGANAVAKLPERLLSETRGDGI